jgi:hypothetical protein
MIPTENASLQSGLQYIPDAIPPHIQSVSAVHGDQPAGDIGAAIPQYFNADGQSDTSFQSGFAFWQHTVPQQQSTALGGMSTDGMAPDSTEFTNFNDSPTESFSPKIIPEKSRRDSPIMRIFNAVFTDWNDRNQQHNFKDAKKKADAAIETFLSIDKRWSDMNRDLKEVIVSAFINAFKNSLRYLIFLRIEPRLTFSVTSTPRTG